MTVTLVRADAQAFARFGVFKAHAAGEARLLVGDHAAQRGEILGHLVEGLGTVGQIEKGTGIASCDA